MRGALPLRNGNAVESVVQRAVVTPRRVLEGCRLLAVRQALGSRLCVAAQSAAQTENVPQEVPEHQPRADRGGEASTSGRSSSQRAESSPRKRQKIQSFDYTSLAACAAELRALWCPSKVDQVVQPDPHTLCLKLRNRDVMDGRSRDRCWLFLSWHQTHARVSLGLGPERGSAAEAFSLADQMHSALRGLVLLQVELPEEWERILRLDFGPRMGEVSHTLFLEVMGNYSNLILTDERGRIIACARQVSSRMSSRRSLQTGAAYAIPPTQSGSRPSEGQAFEDWHRTAAAAGDSTMNVPAALARAYQGVSPALAAELCTRAGLTGAERIRDLTKPELDSLHNEWCSWLRIISESEFRPTVAEDGALSMLGSFTRGSTALEAIDAYYRIPQEDDSLGRLQKSVGSAVSKALRRLEAKQHNLTQQLEQAQQAEATQKRADLIMANLHTYERGADSLTVLDWDTGEEAQVALDPSTPAKDQAEGLYKRARKLRRTSGKIGPLLLELDEDLEFLREIEQQVEALQSGDRADATALQQIQDELVERNFCKPPPDATLAAKGAARGRKASRKSKTAGPDFRQYTSPSGLQVLVGRNNIQNDELTHRVANPTDLWFHARGRPGSHTVLRIAKGRAASDEDIGFAASAAAFFSKARGEGKADVICALVKDLSKPKGGRPGQVLVASERVVTGIPSDCPAAENAKR